MTDMKHTVQKSSAPKKISKIQFGTMTKEEIKLAAEVRVSNREVFQMPLRNAAPYGCMDPRLGISDKTSTCKTCQKRLADCAGHFGYIQLELPVFHAGYFRHTLVILQCICKKCARVLLSTEERASFLKKLRNPNIDSLIRGAIFKRIVDVCKRVSKCPYCSYANGVVKKLTGSCFKIVHEKFRAKGATTATTTTTAAASSAGTATHYISGEQVLLTGEALQQRHLAEIARSHPELKAAVQKSMELLHPVRAFELLKKISDEDTTLLWMASTFGRPESLVLWTVPVPPVPIRPSVPQEMGGGSTEDDLTIKLQEIVEMNNALKMALDKGATMKMVAEDWEYLQIQVALFLNGETPGIPRQLMGTKLIRGLCQRLKGKQGRFRGNLSGKRVDFSGRTVISPDPNLAVDEVGVPELVAKIMTYPERVNEYNIEVMRQAVRNGPEIHPGANMIRSGLHVRALQYANRDLAAKWLRVGDIVERHMTHGDVVLFNRQPSLHKMSIMAHQVRVMPWRTFRFNECACTPYNADFDGDEMNMHLPQTEEAKAEASELMNITNNLVTPRNGEPLVAATQDFLTGAYLLTQKDVFFSKQEFCRLVSYMSDALEQVDLPPPTIWRPIQLWTGKQVMSLLVRPNRHVDCRVNVESEERFYTENKHFCVKDGFVAFRQGELISGNLGKKTLGGESKSGLFYVLIRDYGAAEATRCMHRLSKLCARYLGDKGFSIGIEDVTPSGKMQGMKESILTEGQRQAFEQIDAYKTGRIRLKPGCDALQSLESEVNGLLGKIRENCGKEALVTLNSRNAALNMAQCGSKGSALNISQMMACLGQQSVGGQRIQDGFVNRTLPHFPVGALYPAAKGFVANSFFSGLTATEFFFHTMGGREGLVDTAVKTAETGYMARRLMKALEDLSMQYDSTVRNSEQSVVQFSYGDDGLNPEVMEQFDRPVDFSRLLVNVCSSVPDSQANALTADEISTTVDKELADTRFSSLLPQGRQFLDETKKFFRTIADKISCLEYVEAQSRASPAAALSGTTATTSSGASSVSSDPSKLPVEFSIADLRRRLRAMSSSEKQNWTQQALQEPQSTAFQEMHRLLRDNTLRLTARQLRTILERALNTYYKARIQPGEAVGAVGAQSLSEPGTQMTLKTFHFAGVASMNVTLGVPRLKEIINASNTISTPIIEARLVQSDNKTSARIVKAQIEKTTLGEVVTYIKEVNRPMECYIAIKLDLETIQNLHLNISPQSVKHAILHNSSSAIRPAVLRMLKERHIVICGDGRKIKIFPPEAKETPAAAAAAMQPTASSTTTSAAGGAGNATTMAGRTTMISSHQKVYFILQALKAVLPQVIVQGIPTVSRAVINEEQDDLGKQRYYLLVEGYGLQEVMGCPGVAGAHTQSNHIIEMQKVLGIEAARSMIASEIKYIMQAYGITVDRRHLMLLSDVMTFKGEVLGITRFGVAKMKESVLMLASFEKTTDHLFDAAVHSREDAIVGVSECIIMGVPIPIGTGLFKLLAKPPQPVNIAAQRRTRMMERL